MLRATTTVLLVGYCLAGGTRAEDVPALPPEPIPEPLVHPLATAGDWGPAYAEPLPYRSTELAADPNWGDYSPSRGYLHYDLPSAHYGLWHRPTSFGRGPGERCAPALWNPKGYGNLFAPSSASHRMDYVPYVLHDPASDEGPAYHPETVEYCCGSSLLGCCRCRTGSWLTKMFRRDCH